MQDETIRGGGSQRERGLMRELTDVEDEVVRKEREAEEKPAFVAY